MLRIVLETISYSSKNFNVAESVFELMPDVRKSSLKPFGPLNRCLTTSRRDSVTIALIAPTTGHLSSAGSFILNHSRPGFAM